MSAPFVLSIGGLDPCGGAGIGADARTLHVHGCSAGAVATCLTVQNRRGLVRVEAVDRDLVVAMLRAVRADGRLHAIKLGLVGVPDVLEALGAELADYRGPVVVDPVLSATAGGWKGSADLVAAYRRFAARVAAVWTPNTPELARLAEDKGPGALLALGARAVFVTGGHGEGVEIVDRLVAPAGTTEFRRARVACGAVHGTGCALASALAANLAHGVGLDAAAGRATAWVATCLAAMGPGATLPRPFVPQADAKSSPGPA